MGFGQNPSAIHLLVYGSKGKPTETQTILGVGLAKSKLRELTKPQAVDMAKEGSLTEVELTGVHGVEVLASRRTPNARCSLLPLVGKKSV